MHYDMSQALKKPKGFLKPAHCSQILYVDVPQIWHRKDRNHFAKELNIQVQLPLTQYA